uniref:Uncharacterized protein n=1 Tax=Candidatus Kentrum sp. TC TaxID=2126339 RepID=A0A450YJK5_9GAMM|nr:MAG: hypothetical protein BECKTC1821E_GA0114239_101340 [Candidatus Kentron sp. TC]
MSKKFLNREVSVCNHNDTSDFQKIRLFWFRLCRVGKVKTCILTLPNTLSVRGEASLEIIGISDITQQGGEKRDFYHSVRAEKPQPNSITLNNASLRAEREIFYFLSNSAHKIFPSGQHDILWHFTTSRLSRKNVQFKVSEKIKFRKNRCPRKEYPVWILARSAVHAHVGIHVSMTINNL